MACFKTHVGVRTHLEIDECESSPCSNGATCVNNIGAYHCICVNGYNGTHCEIGNLLRGMLMTE